MSTVSDYRLGDGCTIQHGYAFSKMEESEDETLPVVVNIGNFQYNGGFRFDSTRIQRYSGDYPERFRLSPGDVVVVMTCQTAGGEILGIPGRIPNDGRVYLHNQRLGKVVVTHAAELDLGYLYYLLLSPSLNAHLVSTATGAKIQHTAPHRIEDFRWRRPKLAMQRRIADVLSAYDDLIANNTKRIQILEEMARSLYREWFVELRFPGHQRSTFVDTQIGKMPSGWAIGRLDGHVVVHRGKSYRGVELVEYGGLPFVNLKCFVRDGGFRRDGIKRFVGEARPNQHVRAGDIVMAVTDMTQERRIIARAARVPRMAEPVAVFSMDVVKIEPRAEEMASFLYALLRYSRFADEVKKHANGANVLHLNPDRIEGYVAVIPPASLATRFGELIAASLHQQDVLALKNEALREARYLLLPRFISGEIELRP